MRKKGERERETLEGERELNAMTPVLYLARLLILLYITRAHFATESIHRNQMIHIVPPLYTA